MYYLAESTLSFTALEILTSLLFTITKPGYYIQIIILILIYVNDSTSNRYR